MIFKKPIQFFPGKFEPQREMCLFEAIEKFGVEIVLHLTLLDGFNELARNVEKDKKQKNVIIINQSGEMQNEVNL